MLKVKLSGVRREIVVTTLPRDFVAKVFRHCLGKNNTPYFANNCFKGVLYFDDRMAAAFAEQTDFAWKHWLELSAGLHSSGWIFESSLEMEAEVQGKTVPLGPSETAATDKIVSLTSFLPRIGVSDVLAFLGKADKGSQVYGLEGFEGDFDPAALTMHLELFDDFGLEEPLIAGLSYGGQAMTSLEEDFKGMNMIDPVLIGPNGRFLDLYDFS
jgi:hypothetical protein